jgi:hypothetical protein
MHTLMGAGWKFMNSPQAVPSLKAFPNGLWLALAVVEILCAVGLVVPAIAKPLGVAVPIAAILIAIEMLVFCVVHLASGAGANGQMVYWLVVAAVCAFIAYGRLVLLPL